MINHIISECSKLEQREYQTRLDWVGKMIHWELCKKFKFDHYKKMVYAQPGIRPRKWDAQSSLGFWDTDGSSNLGRTTRPCESQQQQQQQQQKKREPAE